MCFVWPSQLIVMISINSIDHWVLVVETRRQELVFGGHQAPGAEMVPKIQVALLCF